MCLADSSFYAIGRDESADCAPTFTPIDLENFGNPLDTFSSDIPDPADGSGVGVFGTSGTGEGVRGTSRDGLGGHFILTEANGILGESQSDSGVKGQSESGTGVHG